MKQTVSFQKALLTFFIFIVFLIAIRIWYLGKINYLFLIWNIFLAWIPFAISYYFKEVRKEKNWKQFLLFGSWLIFFPNSLYIITDLVHLDKPTFVPKWFDAVLIFSSSIMGLIMAFASLLRVEIFLSNIFKNKWVDIMIITILFLGSFGVYLGRFLRWNSWDIIQNPVKLLSTIVYRVIYPFEYLRTWSMTCILTVLFYLLYIIIKKAPDYVCQEKI